MICPFGCKLITFSVEKTLGILLGKICVMFIYEVYFPVPRLVCSSFNSPGRGKLEAVSQTLTNYNIDFQVH